MLLGLYPDAKLIWTHRDPADVVTSVASLNCALQSIMSEDIDPRVRGPHWLDRLATLAERGMASLDDDPDAAVAHVDYRALVDRPVETVRAIYDGFGLDLDTAGELRMQAWMDANPQNRWGRHRYDPDEFALDRDRVRDRFSAYCERFDV